MSEHRLNNAERQMLNHLMGTALLNERVREQLLDGRPGFLLATSGFTEETRAWLCSIQASSLDELAQAILNIM